MDEKIIIRNRIIMKEGKIFQAIAKELKFPNPQYQQRKNLKLWAGDVPENIFLWRDEGTYHGVRIYSVPLGMKPRIHAICNSFGITPVWIDLRCKEPLKSEIVFRGELLPYQEQAVEIVKNYSLGILHAPAGSGKTVMALSLIPIYGYRTAILVHTRDLVTQWADRCREFLGVEPEIWDGRKRKIDDITIFLYQGCRKSCINEFGFVIADECHHVPAQTFAEVLQRFYPARLLGLTATPYRADKMDKIIHAYVGPIIHRISDSDLIFAQRKIVPLVVPIMTGREFVVGSNREWQAFISALGEDEERNRVIIDNCLREPDNHHLLLSRRVSHCKRIHELLIKNGMKSEVIYGEKPKKEREKILERLKKGEINFLVATSPLADEALDLPILDRLHLLTPSIFEGKLLQQVGRIQRLHPKKKDAIVYDYVDFGSVPMSIYHKREKFYAAQGWEVKKEKVERVGKEYRN